MGTYRLYQNGVLLSEHKNVLTDLGKESIARYMAREQLNWATFFQFGAGESAPLSTQEMLDFTCTSSPIDYRQSNDDLSITLRATLSVDTVGRYYEVGLFNIGGVDTISDYVAETTRFDGSESVILGDYVESDIYARNGAVSFLMSPIDAATDTVTIQGLRQSYESFASSDLFRLAYFNELGNAGTVEVRYENEDGSFYSHTFVPATSGYNIEEWTKGDFIPSGSPDWSRIASVSVSVTAAGGTAGLHLDGLHAILAQPSTGHGMVSRALLNVPVVKEAGVELEVTYTIDLTFGA